MVVLKTQLTRLAMIVLVSLTSSTNCLASVYEGLEDRQGNAIVPREFRTIRCLDSNHYLLEKYDPFNAFGKNRHSVLVDRNGRQLDVPLPADVQLMEYLYEPTVFGPAPNSFNSQQAVFTVRKGDVFGLATIDGTILLEPLYDSIRNLGEGNFGLYQGRQGFLFNKRTKKLSKVSQNVYFGITAYFMDGLIPFRVFSPEDRFGLMNEHGEVAVPPTYGWIEDKCSNGLWVAVTVSEKWTHKKVFIDRTGTIVSPTFDDLHPFINGLALAIKNGGSSNITASEMSQLTTAQRNRLATTTPKPKKIADELIVVYSKETPGFNSQDWRDIGCEKLTHKSRQAAFKQFLQQYDLIGMSREKVKDLLGYERGDDKIWAYMLLSGRCGNAYRGFEIEFEDNEVKRWRTDAYMEHGDWLERNVIYEGRRMDGTDMFSSKKLAVAPIP